MLQFRTLGLSCAAFPVSVVHAKLCCQSEPQFGDACRSRRTGRVWNTLFSLLVVLLVQASAGVSSVYAETVACNATSVPNYSPTLTTTSFPRDAPINSVSPDYQATLVFHCQKDANADRDIFVTFAATPATLASGYDDVYRTNVPGLGVRYKLTDGLGTDCETLPVTVTNGSTRVTCHEMHGSDTPGQDFRITVSVQFVKTANRTIGMLRTIPALTATASANNQAGSWPWGSVVSGSASGLFANQACTVITTAVAVTMPPARVKDLPSVGSTAGDKPLSLTLNCDAGVRVYATLSDATEPFNTGTTLSLTPDSSAQGIGYQILFAGNLVAFGADSAVAGNDNQFPVTSSSVSGGAVYVPLTARYLRTGAVLPGSANAAATFTMSYQ